MNKISILLLACFSFFSNLAWSVEQKTSLCVVDFQNPSARNLAALFDNPGVDLPQLMQAIALDPNNGKKYILKRTGDGLQTDLILVPTVKSSSIGGKVDEIIWREKNTMRLALYTVKEANSRFSEKPFESALAKSERIGKTIAIWRTTGGQMRYKLKKYKFDSDLYQSEVLRLLSESYVHCNLNSAN